MAMQSEFIPCITSEAGFALTAADWSAMGVRTLAFDMNALLIKPGFELLGQISSLAHYVSWSDEIVLNACRLHVDAKGDCLIRSPFDGQINRFRRHDLITLMQHLQPKMLIIPTSFMAEMPESFPHEIQLFVKMEPNFTCSEHELGRIHGFYYAIDTERLDFHALAVLREKYKTKKIYVQGEFSLSMQQRLVAAGVNYIESGTPGTDAMQGSVYSRDTAYSVLDEDKRMCFTRVDSRCGCPTCSAGFTWAYLHHLFTQTPGLCQRLLIQHNIHYVLSFITHQIQ
ncbi:MAG: hypothetical protein B7X00_00530 [Legionella sp. 21-45-4]|nr:MAG: hypothetical protein B7X00_00530 [Legionella sp. 21-45-4]